MLLKMYIYIYHQPFFSSLFLPNKHVYLRRKKRKKDEASFFFFFFFRHVGRMRHISCPCNIYILSKKTYFSSVNVWVEIISIINECDLSNNKVPLEFAKEMDID